MMSGKSRIYLDSDMLELPPEYQKDVNDALKDARMVCAAVGLLEPLNDLHLTSGQARAKDAPGTACTPRVQVNSFKNCKNFHIIQNQIVYRNRSDPRPKRKPQTPKGADGGAKNSIVKQLSREDVTKLERLKACQEEVSLDDLTNLKGHIGPKKWKPLGRELGFHEAKLDYLKSDHCLDGMEEVVYQMLVDARQQRERLTYSRLAATLENCDLADVAILLYTAEK